MSSDPAWLRWARGELGVRETPGRVSTKRIIEYRDIAGIKIGGDDSDVPWCAIFVNAALASAKIPGSGNAMARGFLHWGEKIEHVTAGAIVVFSSSRGPTSGHVAIATGRETAIHVDVCGGNQHDEVCLAWFPKKMVLGYRWPVGVPMLAGGAQLVAGPATVASVKDS